MSSDMSGHQEEKRRWILGDKFDARMPHHDGIKALWETKWKFPVSLPVKSTTAGLTLLSVRRVFIPFTMANLRTSSQYSSI
jgi:hypothetical protein